MKAMNNFTPGVRYGSIITEYTDGIPNKSIKTCPNCLEGKVYDKAIFLGEESVFTLSCKCKTIWHYDVRQNIKSSNRKLLT